MTTDARRSEASDAFDASDALDAFDAIVGTSAVMRDLVARLARIAPSSATILLCGETGTGKSMVAETIHRASGRAGRFVVIDCGALPPSLIEGELFGHERGAFTGADARRPGLFELAGNGTVFLDEIGELSLELQPRLLRVLENRSVRRVGGGEEIGVGARVIAATNRDLVREVARGGFRSDLYYRLSTIQVAVPPLRERQEDVPHLVERFARELGVARSSDLEPLLAALARRTWTGNARELRAVVERWLVLGELDIEKPSNDPPRDDRLLFETNQPFRTAKLHAISWWERAWLSALLTNHGWNLSRAARAARMDRTHLRELVRRHRLRSPR